MLAAVKLTSATRQNLWRLTFIRTLVLAAQAGSVGLAYWFDLLPLPWLQLAVTLGFSTVLCVFTAIRLRTTWPVTELEYALQLACDLFIHSVLLYFSGGSTNPFVSYYLVPLTIAAVTLPWRYSVVLSGIALTLYTLLLAQFYPLQTFPIARENLQIYGMWLSFALSAAVITFFAARMAEELRRQEELRAIRREEGLRDQQLLAVATQAAGAAHELGTPLATMSVLLKEMTQDHHDPALQDDLSVLQEQVKQCKLTLQQLVRAAEANRRLAVEMQDVTQWLDEALNRWHLMRPEASYRFNLLGQGSVPRMAPPPDLTQALLNLLNNAADACPEGLGVQLDWDAENVTISIRDHGAGVPLAIAEQIGKPFFTTKGKGFGLGLFLSKASVTRAGGSVKLYSHEEGGTLTELRLPVSHEEISMSDEIQVEGEELPHLLLVDDDATFTRVMARAMSRRGFRVSTAGSAEEGLTIAQADLPDYAALDLKMDGDSGLVLLPKLLELDPEMRVVILTGYSSIATAVEAIKRGACNYLCKPADADDVLAALLSEHADLDTLVPENPMSVDRLQWEHIQRVLTEHEGNISATARALGMHRRTLQRKLQKRPVRR